jgi:hypothetical protein
MIIRRPAATPSAARNRLHAFKTLFQPVCQTQLQAVPDTGDNRVEGGGLTSKRQSIESCFRGLRRLIMPHNMGINSSFPAVPFWQRFQERINMLNQVGGEQMDASALAAFDEETEELIREAYGETNDRLEAYRYATMAEAESVVNLPESAQEEAAQDLPKKAIQQRRQVLEGCRSEFEEVEVKEAQALAGEDHEDPPGMS